MYKQTYASLYKANGSASTASASAVLLCFLWGTEPVFAPLSASRMDQVRFDCRQGDDAPVFLQFVFCESVIYTAEGPAGFSQRAA